MHTQPGYTVVSMAALATAHAMAHNVEGCIGTAAVEIASHTHRRSSWPVDCNHHDIHPVRPAARGHLLLRNRHKRRTAAGQAAVAVAHTVLVGILHSSQVMVVLDVGHTGPDTADSAEAADIDPCDYTTYWRCTPR